MSSSNPFDNLNIDNQLQDYAPSQNYDIDNNPFDKYFEIQDKQKEETLKRVLSLAQQKDPNRTGKAQILAEELGIPPDMALDSEDVLDILEERKRQQEIQNINAQNLAMINPLLAKQLRDPNFAAISYDNIPRLGKVESLMNGLKKQIPNQERYDPVFYKCPNGYDTIGYGFAIKDLYMDKEVADLILDKKIRGILVSIESNDDWNEWFWNKPKNVKEVLINMIFQIGFSGVRKFKKTIQYIKDDNFLMASEEMLDSKWARSDSPNRAKELSEIIKSQ